MFMETSISTTTILYQKTFSSHKHFIEHLSTGLLTKDPVSEDVGLNLIQLVRIITPH